jgi:hypothetical protein
VGAERGVEPTPVFPSGAGDVGQDRGALGSAFAQLGQGLLQIAQSPDQLGHAAHLAGGRLEQITKPLGREMCPAGRCLVQHRAHRGQAALEVAGELPDPAAEDGGRFVPPPRRIALDAHTVARQPPADPGLEPREPAQRVPHQPAIGVAPGALELVEVPGETDALAQGQGRRLRSFPGEVGLGVAAARGRTGQPPEPAPEPA